MSAATYMPSAGDVAAAIKSLDAAEHVRKLKAQFETNQAAIMQEAVKNWPVQTSTVGYVPIRADNGIDFGDTYTFRMTSYPELKANPFVYKVAEPAKPEPLSYNAFCEIVAAVVKEEAPAIKVVTDCNQNTFIVWLECNGVKRDREFIFNMDELFVRDMIANDCIDIRNELGDRAAGCR